MLIEKKYDYVLMIDNDFIDPDIIKLKVAVSDVIGINLKVW